MMEKHITLFTDILPEEQERMRVCFHAEKIFSEMERRSWNIPVL